MKMNRTSMVEKGFFQFKRVKSVNALVKISILSVLAYVVMMIESPLFFFPVFLKMDLSDLPALIGGFALGPAAGVLIELIKNVLHFVTKTTTGGVGEIANFLVGSALIIPSTVIYGRYRTKKAAAIGMFSGIIVMGIAGGLANYYMLLPFYGKVIPMDKIIALGTAVNPLIVDIKTLIFYAVIPFNLVKGIVVALITRLVYKKLSPIIK